MRSLADQQSVRPGQCRARRRYGERVRELHNERRIWTNGSPSGTDGGSDKSIKTRKQEGRGQERLTEAPGCAREVNWLAADWPRAVSREPTGAAGTKPQEKLARHFFFLFRTVQLSYPPNPSLITHPSQWPRTLLSLPVS